MLLVVHKEIFRILDMHTEKKIPVITKTLYDRNLAEGI